MVAYKFPLLCSAPKVQEQPLLDSIKLIHSSFPELVNSTELMSQNKWEKIVIITNIGWLRRIVFNFLFIIIILLLYIYIFDAHIYNLWTLKPEF